MLAVTSGKDGEVKRQELVKENLQVGEGKRRREDCRARRRLQCGSENLLAFPAGACPERGPYWLENDLAL